MRACLHSFSRIRGATHISVPISRPKIVYPLLDPSLTFQKREGVEGISGLGTVNHGVKIPMREEE